MTNNTNIKWLADKHRAALRELDGIRHLIEENRLGRTSKHLQNSTREGNAFQTIRLFEHFPTFQVIFPISVEI